VASCEAYAGVACPASNAAISIGTRASKFRGFTTTLSTRWYATEEQYNCSTIIRYVKLETALIFQRIEPCCMEKHETLRSYDRSSELTKLPFIPETDSIKRVTSGEFGDVYILDDLGLVVKFIKGIKDSLHACVREALIVADISNRSDSPLILPELEECAFYYYPAYNIFRKVEGVTLDSVDVKKFSDAERCLLGRKMGEFAAWMADAMSLEIYDEIAQDTEEYRPFSRSAILQQRVNDVSFNWRVEDTIGHLVLELYDHHELLRASGRLESTIVGHADLRPANMTFIKDKEGWKPYGVIDFGIAQPTTPEEELRHAAILGEDIAREAVRSYEKKTGQLLDFSLIGFWAIVQAANICGYIEAFHDRASYKERYKTLASLIDVYADVAGLDVRSFQGRGNRIIDLYSPEK